MFEKSTLQSTSEKKNLPNIPTPNNHITAFTRVFFGDSCRFFLPCLGYLLSLIHWFQPWPSLTWRMAGGVHLEFTLLLTNRTSPLKPLPGPKRKFHLPTIIFRRTVSFREGNIPWRHLRWPLRMSLLSKSWKGSYPTGSHWQTFKNWKTDWVVYTFMSKYSHNVFKWGFQFNKKNCRTRESNYSNHGTKTWILQSGVTLYLFLSVEDFGRISITFNQPRFDKQSYSLPKMWLVMPQTIVHTGRYINSTEQAELKLPSRIHLWFYVYLVILPLQKQPNAATI